MTSRMDLAASLRHRRVVITECATEGLTYQMTKSIIAVGGLAWLSSRPGPTNLTQRRNVAAGSTRTLSQGPAITVSDHCLGDVQLKGWLALNV